MRAPHYRLDVLGDKAWQCNSCGGRIPPHSPCAMRQMRPNSIAWYRIHCLACAMKDLRAYGAAAADRRATLARAEGEG